MPVQPVISLEQIVIIVAFLMILFALMWFVRRHRGGITSRIHADRPRSAREQRRTARDARRFRQGRGRVRADLSSGRLRRC